MKKKGKLKKKIWKKKEKKEKRKKLAKKKEKRKALWIIVVIHSVLCVGEQYCNKLATCIYIYSEKKVNARGDDLDIRDRNLNIGF
jgi:TPP-dependent indolepyruvate ferredoxin oxidoreductase alpha subunit